MKEKKFDKNEVENLQNKIAAEMKHKPAKRSPIALELKQINIVKAINPKASKTLQGAWNGYGYTNLGKHLFPENLLEIKNGLKKLNVEEKKEKVEVSFEDKMQKWAKRLSKLAEITFNEALKIAEEKIDYKNEQIWKVEERQNDRFSIQREKLINKMERENPLRPIKDIGHAQAILAASHRHNNTDYESKLEEGREMAESGIIDREDVKGYARREIQE